MLQEPIHKIFGFFARIRESLSPEMDELLVVGWHRIFKNQR
jgi:hypothetical protein